MNWEDARLFLAVARAGQILGASSRLGISQSKLSRRVSALEVSIGQKLIIRRRLGCDLTEAGKVLVETLERVETDFVRTESELSNSHAQLTGEIRVGAPDGFGAAFLAPRIGKFCIENPELKVQLAPVPRSFSLSKREADIAVLVGRPQVQGLIARKLTDYSLSVYASRDYLKANGIPESVDDLREHQLLDYVEDLIYSPLLDYSQEVWNGWNANLQITSALAQVAAVKGGAGIAILHDYIATQDNDLVRILPSKSVLRTYWIVYHESLRDIPRVRAVLDFMIGLVEESRADFLLGAE